MALQSVNFLDLITFTRASSGTYFDSSGVMQTASTNVARFNYLYNGSAWEPAGLLIEPAATNLMDYSEASDNAFWTKTGVTVISNATTAPDGASTADKIVEVAAASTPGLVRGTITVASATDHTFSIFAKSAERTQIRLVMEGSASFSAYFDLSAGTVGSVGGSATASIKPCGNGWYRCILKWTTGSTNANPYIATASAGAVIASGDATKGVFLWGAQLETGSVATSYIPTAGSTATRAADVAVISGTNFSDWFNPLEGTFVFEGDTAKPTSSASVVAAAAFTNGSTTFADIIFASSNANARATVAGAAQASISQSYTANATQKLAFAFKQNDFALARNGSLVGTDTSGTMPGGLDRLFIGCSASSFQLNGHIRRLTYYPTRLSDAQLATLSTL